MAFQSQAMLEWSLLGIFLGLEATYERVCVVGTFNLEPNLTVQPVSLSGVRGRLSHLLVA